MMKSLIYTVVSSMMLLGFASVTSAQTENYSQPSVSISKDKVEKKGISYYSHVVLEKQTLYSISKTYGVSVQQIYDANPELDLEQNGLKKHQSLLIPVSGQAKEKVSASEKASVPEEGDVSGGKNSSGEVSVSEKESTDGYQEYVIHQVKWFEDIRSIAKKYGLSVEEIVSFNSLQSTSLEWKQKIRIPVKSSERTVTGQKSDISGYGDSTTAENERGEEDRTGNKEEDSEDGKEEHSGPGGLWHRGQKKVTASLIIPFDAASASPNENNFDFYSGVLIALRDLQKEGISTELNVYDNSKKINIIAADIKGSDVVIGPIASEDLTTVLNIFPSATAVVSPIEPKAEALASAHENIIQTPASAQSQCEELICWLKEEKRWDDKVILFTESGVAPSGNAKTIIEQMQAQGISYESISHDVKDGFSVADRLEKKLSGTGTNRIVIASESKAFLNDVIRASNSMTNKKFEVALYCPSRVRSYDDIEIEQLHRTKLHVALSYYVDYSDERVGDFLRAYRALYGKEPSVVAFKGYDAAYYVIKMRSLYGDAWMRQLGSRTSMGLQTDFRFERVGDEGGYVNKAVRRVIYEPSFDIRLAR